MHLHDAASELIGSVCLSLFLTWTMMTLHLADVVHMAGPLLVILAAQTMLVAAWATWVTFPALGRDYESAIIAGAFCGFAMVATAPAIANMQALTRRHGPAPQAFVVRYAPCMSGTRRSTAPESLDLVGQLGERPLFGINQRPDLFGILHAAHSLFAPGRERADQMTVDHARYLREGIAL